MRFDVHDKNADKARSRIERQLDVIAASLRQISSQLGTSIQQEEQQMADLSALQAEVEQNGEVGASAVALLNGLNQQLQDAIASNDPAALQALSDQLSSQTDTLAAAVTNNTPHADNTLPGDLPAEGGGA